MSVLKYEKFSEKTHLILTPNARLSLSLSEDYTLAKSQNSLVFAPLNIKPLSAFIDSLWNLAILHIPHHLSHRLSPFLQHYLFSQAINSISPELPVSLSLIEQVKSAWKNCQLWSVAINEENFNFSFETESFYKWAKKYQALKGNAIDSSEIFKTLLPHLNKLIKFLPKEILLLECDSLSPMEKTFFDALRALGIKVYHQNNAPYQHDNIKRLTLDNPDKESQALINWLDEKIKNTDDSIGVIVTNLSERKATLHQKLQNAFPEKLINFSMGTPLTETPLVFTLLSALRLLNETKFSKETLITLLKSPFVGDESEYSHRFKTTKTLESWSTSKISFDYFLQHGRSTSFNQRLEKTLKIERPKKAFVSFWTKYTLLALDTFGLPGKTPLSSHNYQCFQKFIHSLDSLATLDEFCGEISFNRYLSLLNQNLSLTLFQPEREKKARIHVLGFLEGLGLHFDALWIMGVNDESLPAQLKRNPFIPHPLQKKLKMPKSSVSEELKYAKTAIEKFKRCAKEVYFSFFHQDEANEYRISPLIEDLAIASSFTAKKLMPFHFNKKNNSFKVPLKNKIHKANTTLIKEQASCPFRAFAKFRLKLRVEPSHLYGFSPIERGIFLHRALELFWLTIKTKKHLDALSEFHQHEKINEAIDKAALELNLQKHEILGVDFLSLEKKHLFTLLKNYLALEATREDFIVYQNEEKIEFKLNDITFSLRADRIDKSLDDENLVLIDYKSGYVTPSKWFEERLTEPQIPLYALAFDKINTLCYYQLKPSMLAIKGVSETLDEVKGINLIEKVQKTDWSSQKEKWQGEITALIEEYKNGIISPTPKSNQLCRECEFMALCRQEVS